MNQIVNIHCSTSTPLIILNLSECWSPLTDRMWLWKWVQGLPYHSFLKRCSRSCGQGSKGMFNSTCSGGTGPSLFGRNWIGCLKIHKSDVYCVNEGMFQKILNLELSLPRFSKGQSVPCALHEKVDMELKRLVNEGILESGQFAEWASSIFSVLKSDCITVRICGDFNRQNVNPISKLDGYPIPKVEDLFARLAVGRSVTKLHLSQAYQKVPLDDQSKKFAVINTNKGLFYYTRLPYRISSAPGILQRVTDNLLKGNQGVVVYLDDKLETGVTTKEHCKSLDEVLNQLERAGLRAKKNKCQFMAPSVTFQI